LQVPALCGLYAENPGSHVIIVRIINILNKHEQAAELRLFNSKARGSSLVTVDYTLAKNKKSLPEQNQERSYTMSLYYNSISKGI
jgi:predicted ribosome quality control (RQC) complex YloA/Tae2 family protein